MQCEHGCGLKALFKSLKGKNSCCSNAARCPAVKRKTSITKRRKKDAKLQQQKWDFVNLNLEELCKKYSLEKLKEKFLDEQDGGCGLCGISEWNDKPLTLEFHHKNGHNYDNSRKNVIVICPNCHSQTDNFKNKKESEENPNGRRDSAARRNEPDEA